LLLAKIFLSNGIEFNSSDGQTILDAARQNNIAIEHSCRNGRCGICIAPVLSGNTEPVTVEESLSTEDLASAKILTCCRVALSDVHLNIEDLGAIGNLPVLTLPCRIDSIRDLNDDVIELLLRLPPGSDFNFFAGQYLDLIYAGFRRSYSIANSVRSDSKIELQVKRVKGGKMSEYLFSQAAQDDLLRLEGPRGTFSYRDDTAVNLVLMATGTGIAPIKAMLEDFNTRQIVKNIYVVWGGRVSADLYFDTSLTGVRHTFIPVLSREQQKGTFSGYVQDAVLGLGLDLKDTTVYACGSKIMIRDAMVLLVENGLSTNRFYSDAFVSSK
jgi:CDP-4-dehydro-6-deoxyglucose reductase